MGIRSAQLTQSCLTVLSQRLARGRSTFLVSSDSRAYPFPFPTYICVRFHHYRALTNYAPHSNTYQDSLKLLASGQLPNVAKLVTTRIPLAEAKKAFETVVKGVDDEGKFVLKVVSSISTRRIENERTHILTTPTSQMVGDY